MVMGNCHIVENRNIRGFSATKGREVFDQGLFQNIDTTGAKWVLCIPDQLRREIRGYMHSECGHYGITKTVKYIQNYCVFRGMYRTVAKVIGLCLICAQTKAPNRKCKGMMGHVLATKPLVCVDLFGPLPKGREGGGGGGVEHTFL
ncbi:hypothetical protein PR048_001790 [Dryococelus australis]|uniref:Integrase zinc-binding domain-containing protein n=1 Tax=Dryococelus australis TaxID=614101 RepID=A0ABQ9IIG3_9NEOP|nr:hypothetical protein PR048_001790 [Dryococelus australis]